MHYNTGAIFSRESSRGSGQFHTMDESSVTPEPNFDDSRSYVLAVKEAFQDEPAKYEEFKTLLNDYRAKRVDSVSLITSVEELMRNHMELLPGFSVFHQQASTTILPEAKRTIPLENPRVTASFQRSEEKDLNLKVVPESSDLLGLRYDGHGGGDRADSKVSLADTVAEIPRKEFQQRLAANEQGPILDSVDIGLSRCEADGSTPFSSMNASAPRSRKVASSASSSRTSSTETVAKHADQRLAEVVSKRASRWTSPKPNTGLESRGKSSPLVSLPADLVEQILLRLPIKSLLRLKWACKQWTRLLREKRFVDAKLKMVEYKFLHSRLTDIWELDLQDQTYNKILEYTDAEFRSLSHCEGLVLFTLLFYNNAVLKIAIWNPIQDVCTWIDRAASLYDFYCLGRDNRMRYKVLRFNFGHFDESCELFEQEAELFDLNSSSWKEIEFTDDWSITFPRQFTVVSVDGNSYWLVEEGMAPEEDFVCIQSFDFTAERFMTISVPVQVKPRPWMAIALSSFEGDKLQLLYQQHQKLQTQIWRADSISDIGIANWVKKFDVTVDHPLFQVPSFIASDKKISLLSEEVTEDGTIARINLVKMAGAGVEKREIAEYVHTRPANHIRSSTCVYVPTVVPVPTPVSWDFEVSSFL